MKSNILFVCMAAMMTLSLVACNKDKGAEAKVDEKQKVQANTGAASYNINSAASVVNWEGYKPTGTHSGTVAVKSGEVKVENGKVVGGSIELDMTSINVLDLQGGDKEGLEAHLKGLGKEDEVDHFFNTKKYPTGKFEITKVAHVESNPAANIIISGNLSLKDATHNISFPAKADVKPNMVSITAPKFNIDRTKWNVKYASKTLIPNIGDKFINDEIGLTFTLMANK